MVFQCKKELVTMFTVICFCFQVFAKFTSKYSEVDNYCQNQQNAVPSGPDSDSDYQQFLGIRIVFNSIQTILF